MKGLIKLVLVGAMPLFSINALAMGVEFEDLDTTCYVFNSGNLIKKGSCTYSGMAGANGWGGGWKAKFNINGYGKINVTYSVSFNEGGNINEEVTINDDTARIRYRDINSLKVLEASEAEKRREAWIEQGNTRGWKNMGTPNYISCHKHTKSGLELCFIDNIPS